VKLGRKRLRNERKIDKNFATKKKVRNTEESKEIFGKCKIRK
jgi:hypothetical protein